MSSITLGSLFILVSFIAYASDIMFLAELIPLALLLFPVYLYARKRKVLNVFFVVGLVYSGARFYMNYLLHAEHPNIIALPISISQPIIKQFTGMTVIIALFIWYTYILYATLISIKDRCDKAVTYEGLIGDKQILHFLNLFKTTATTVFLEIVLFTWMYDLTSVLPRMIVFLSIIMFMSICFIMFVHKMEADKKTILYIDSIVQEVIGGRVDSLVTEDIEEEDMED